MNSEITSAVSCDLSYDSDQIRPVSLIMVKDDKKLITKTEYSDGNSLEEIAIEKSIDQEMPPIKTEDEISEGLKDFAFSNIENQCEAMSVIKSEEIIKSECKDLSLNGNSNAEKGITFTEHVISVVKAEENANEFAFDCGFSSVNEESVISDIDQVNGYCITVNAEATQLFEPMKTEPTKLDDFLGEHCEQNVHRDQIKIEPTDLSNIIKPEQSDYSMNTTPCASFDVVENDSEIVVKTEVDESCLFEYPEIVTNDLNGKEYPDDYKYGLHNSHNRACPKEKCSRKRLRRNKAPSVEERPLTHKRRLTISTKMKDYVSDYVPYTSRKKRCTERKARNVANIVGACHKKKHGRKVLRGNFMTSVSDRPLSNKRLIHSTKMKDCDSDYVRYISQETKTKKHKTRKVANKVKVASSVKIVRKTKKVEGVDRVQMEVAGIRESLFEASVDTSTNGCQDPQNFEGNSQLQEEKPDLPFKCSICNKKFDTFAYLQFHLTQHERIKTRKKYYTCRLCGRNFRWDTSLRNHLLRHTKEKPHICKICKRGFSVEGNLRRHMLSHDVRESGERKYKCDKCEKDFLYEQHLKRHMTTHNGLYLCHICGKGYVETYDLHTHIRRSHDKVDNCSKNNKVDQPQSNKQRKRKSKTSSQSSDKSRSNSFVCRKRKSKKSSQSSDKSRSNSFVCLWRGREFFIASDSLKHFEECDKKPRKSQTETLSQNKSLEDLSPSNSQSISPEINFILILPTKPDVMPIVSSIKPLTIQSKAVAIPTKSIFTSTSSQHANPLCRQMRSRSQTNTVSTPVTQTISNSTSTVYLKPVLIPITSLVVTKPTISKTIPIPTSIPGVMPLVSSVIPLTKESNSVIKPVIPEFISAPSVLIIPEKILLSSKSTPNTVSNYSVTQMVSKPISIINTKPGLIPIMSSLIPTQSTNTATTPKFLPTVHTSQVINQTKTNCSTSEMPKMHDVKFNRCCTWCNKTFKDVSNFKHHTYYCKPKNMLLCTSMLSEDGVDISSRNGTTSASSSRSNSTSAQIDLTGDHIATTTSKNLTETPKVLSDNLTENSGLTTPQTVVHQTHDAIISPNSESASANGIMLPVCPFAVPLSP